jgi:hypothetical protein
MGTICPRCSRRNPGEARYCYFDGSALSAAGGRGPLQAGSLPFPRPFVFPGGEACTSFNQLAVACQRHWDLARDLVRQGPLEMFLAGLGRLDLAQAARAAGQAPDPDRALDEFLARLPSDVLDPPRLRTEPAVINLGVVPPGRDTRFDLVLANQGMRLLFGAVASDCEWLALGEGPGRAQKVFQTPGEIAVPVQVLGHRLRAGPRPIEGRLCVDSNGGAATVVVRADVPVRPFPAGVLAGARTPRELAVKARASPAEAALLFEQGAVEQWYKDNGWDYPVQGPAGSGLGAVQQFFEALGLVKPPRVTISETAVCLRGSAGERLAHRLQVRAEEKRPAFAHGWSDQPWLRVGPPEFHGPLVELPVEVVVPDQPGEQLEARISVRANGNQRFEVAVTLVVGDSPLPVVEIVEPLPVVVPVVPARGRVAEAPAAATFGMGRLVYWGGILGGWSAFAGWLVAELTIGWWVRQSALLAVLMVVLVAGAVGAAVTQTEGLITGQWRALRGRLWLGLVGGLAGGLVGGLLGSGLYWLLGQRFVVLGFLGRVLGWTLIGVAIGAGEGLLRGQWRQVRNGLIGGSIGGFLGGLFFDPVGYVIGSPVSSRAFAFVLLGLFVGLSLGLVQVLLKEAWLTVEEGFRPGRQLILTQEVTTLGTSEGAGLIFIAYGARGVEPVHARIRREEGGTFVLEDNRSRTGTLLNGSPAAGGTPLRDGDLIQLGVNKVRFNERYRPRPTPAGRGPARAVPVEVW